MSELIQGAAMRRNTAEGASKYYLSAIRAKQPCNNIEKVDFPTPLGPIIP